jgi:hypothetical protein
MFYVDIVKGYLGLVVLAVLVIATIFFSLVGLGAIDYDGNKHLQLSASVCLLAPIAYCILSSVSTFLSLVYSLYKVGTRITFRNPKLKPSMIFLMVFEIAAGLFLIQVFAEMYRQAAHL